VSTYDPTKLPDGLPAPVDDGGADHLPGVAVPPVELPATDGRTIRLDRPEPGSEALARTVVYAYPRTGRPGEEPLVADWDEIPGARGCTPETCAFRDHHAELRAAGAEVYGLSTQDTDYQREASERLNLPFPLLSDADLLLTRALRLPTFEAAGQTLIKRVTLVVHEGRIEHVFYPVFPPDGHAEQVLEWLRANRTSPPE
jgi:peroxiredoxin